MSDRNENPYLVQLPPAILPTGRPMPDRLPSRFAWPLVAMAVVSVAFAITPLVNSVRKPHANKDYKLWYAVGQDVRNGLPLYQPGENGEVLYMYPPTAAVLLFAPLSYLGPIGFVAAFVVATAAAWFGCLYLAVVLATGWWPGHPNWYYFLTYAAVGPYVYDLFLLGQVNLILLCFVLLAARLLQRRRPWPAGLLLGLAIAIKVFPLPILVYWTARRQWTAILSAGLTIGVTLVLLPGLVRGLDRNLEELGQWQRLMVGDQSGNTMAARSSIGFTRRNQSLVSVAHRLLRDVEAVDVNRPTLKVNVANLTPGEAQLVGLGGVCLLGLVLLLATRCRFARTPAAEAQEWAMVCTLVVLSSPLSWTYFFCWLLPAWAVLLNEARSHRWVRGPTAVGGLLLASALSEQVDPRLQAYGVTAWGAVVLYLTLAAVRWREPMVHKMDGNERLHPEERP